MPHKKFHEVRGRAGLNIRGVAEVEGVEELLGKLRRLEADVSEELGPAMKEGATVIKDAANRLAPGPHVDIEIEGLTDAGAVVAIGPVEKKWYYRFFELGATAHEITGRPLAFEGQADTVVTGRVQHSGMAAKPFLRPAFDQHKDKAIETIQERLKQRIEQLAKGA